jgi:hypothetical protein
MMLPRSQRKKLDDGARASVAAAREPIDRVSDKRVPFLLVKITDALAISGQTNRWEYSWVRAEVLNNAAKQFQQVPSEAWYTGTAYNAMEGGNNATTVGPGVLVANIPPGFSVKPVAGYVLIFPHRLTDGTERWLFCVPNAIDGICS